ncbi:MAG TPA: hypothetical protein PLS82_09800, partial [Phycisphaerae bacterium]|nr:hypothetical protein [Phycisphaerae bacterium]
MAVRAFAVDDRPSVEAVIAALAQRPTPAVLDSAEAGPGRGRYTIMAFDPVEAHSWDAGGKDPFEAMRSHLERTVASMPQGAGMCTTVQ